MSKIFKNKKLIYWLVVILSVVVLLYPPGLPISTLPSSVTSFEIIDNLPNGSVVVLAADLSLGTWVRMGPLTIAVMKHVVNRDLKFFVFTQTVEGQMLIYKIMAGVDTSKKVYGVDYALFGYVPGQQAGIASIAANVHETLKADLYNTPISKLRVMDDVKTAADFDLLLVTVDSTIFTYYVNQMISPYNLHALALTGESYLPQVANYMASGLFDGYVWGLRGAADYEFLSKNPGPAIKTMDIQSILHMTLISFILIGNVNYFWKRGKEK